MDNIGGVIITVLVSITVDCGFEGQSDETRDQ